MTREEVFKLGREAGDIVRLAREAGFEQLGDAPHWHPYFERIVNRAVETEREACAKLCDGWTHADGDRCAANIRARGSK
jgi:hypothetical protein